MIQKLALAFALVVIVALAQDKPTNPQPSAEQTVTLLKADRAVESLDKDLTVLQQKYAESQLFLNGAQKQYNDLFTKKMQAEKDRRDAKDKVLKDLKLDLKKFDIDDKQTVVQKVDEPAKEAK